MEQLHAWLKRLLSYRKGAWTLEDYPVRLRKQDVAALEQPGRLKPIVWSAQIINWWQIAGHGDTKEEAVANLRASFANFRDSHDTLPRPGTGAPLEFASSDLIERHEELARDFMTRIVDQNYDECFISDESSLHDFHADSTNDEYYRKIALVYGVDVSDVDGARLGLMFERISSHRRAG